MKEMFKNQIVRYKVVYDRKKEAAKKGKALVQIEAYQDGNRRYFSTGIYLTPEQWNKKKRDAKDPYFSALIRNSIASLEKHEKELRYYGDGNFTLSQFDLLKTKAAQELKAVSVQTFNQFFASQLKARDKEFKWNTYRQQQSCLNLLNNFNPSIPFEDLKFKLIDELNQFMLGKGHGKSTTQKRHVIIKGHIDRAIKLELLLRNPYDTFNIPKPVVNKDSLLASELRLIEDTVFQAPESRLEKVRDMFLLSVYTGLRWGDIVSLEPSNFIETEQGLALHIKASKTGRLFKLPLHIAFDGRAEPIVRAYMPKNMNQKLFRGIYNAFANKTLKTIGKQAGVMKTLHFHMARHTAATLIAQKAGVPTAKAVLQHQKLETTLGYLHHSGEDVNNALEGVKNWY